MERKFLTFPRSSNIFNIHLIEIKIHVFVTGLGIMILVTLKIMLVVDFMVLYM